MRRFDKIRHIQKLNENLNNKKNSLAEYFKPGEGSEKEYFDHILQGHEATEENAYDHARGMNWMEVGTTSQTLPNLNYIDTVDGIEIYYDRGADYYCFAPAEDEMGESAHDDYFNQFTPNRDKSIDGPRQPEVHYDREMRSLKPNSRFGESEIKNDINLLNEGTLSTFDKLCGVKITKEDKK